MDIAPELDQDFGASFVAHRLTLEPSLVGGNNHIMEF
jgi:hypothetical protein